MCEREFETEQNSNILTPTLIAITVFLSRSPGLLNRGLGAQPLWDMFLITASSLQLVWSPTAIVQSVAWGPPLRAAGLLYHIFNWTSCAPSYIIVRRPSSSCGRPKSHSFNPYTVKVIFWYSSTGCTCYLHRCISYFESPAELEVNIQHMFFYAYWCSCRRQCYLMQLAYSF